MTVACCGCRGWHSRVGVGGRPDLVCDRRPHAYLAAHACRRRPSATNRPV